MTNSGELEILLAPEGQARRLRKRMLRVVAKLVAAALVVLFGALVGAGLRYGRNPDAADHDFFVHRVSPDLHGPRQLVWTHRQLCDRW